MRKEMDRIWDRFSKEFSSSTSAQDWNPPLNLTETEDSLVAALEVPAINPEDVDISVTGEMLTITGEKEQEEDVAGAKHHLAERVYGKFSRSIRLPTAVDPDRVEARYKHGVLLIKMGKTESPKSKRIKVKTG